MRANDDDITLYLSPSRGALHTAISQLYERARERIASRDTHVVDNDTGEVIERQYRVTFSEDRDGRSLRQLRFYWGVVLKQISEQAMLNGARYSAKGWHEAFKRQVLGFEVVKVQVAGRKHPQVYRRLRSTTDLTVKQMSEYLDEIIATATTDLGVVFNLDPVERESVRWRRKPRKVVAPAEREAVEA